MWLLLYCQFVSARFFSRKFLRNKKDMLCDYCKQIIEIFKAATDDRNNKHESLQKNSASQLKHLNHIFPN